MAGRTLPLTTVLPKVLLVIFSLLLRPREFVTWPLRDDEKQHWSLKNMFPMAAYRQMVDMAQQNVLYIFTHDWSKLSQVKLHLARERLSN
jgi:hypothetical protein